MYGVRKQGGAYCTVSTFTTPSNHLILFRSFPCRQQLAFVNARGMPHNNASVNTAKAYNKIEISSKANLYLDNFGCGGRI